MIVDEQKIIEQLKQWGFIFRKDLSRDKKIAFSKRINHDKSSEYSLRVYVEILEKYSPENQKINEVKN